MISANLVVLRTWLEARFVRTERGASLVEYLLLLTGIAILVILAVAFFGGQVNAKYSSTGTSLDDAF